MYLSGKIFTFVFRALLFNHHVVIEPNFDKVLESFVIPEVDLKKT